MIIGLAMFFILREWAWSVPRISVVCKTAHCMHLRKMESIYICSRYCTPENIHIAVKWSYERSLI